jgi:hypothetical protein
MTLAILDNSLDWVKTHPERFFSNGAPNEIELIRAVWMDAMLLGADAVLVKRHAGVTIVAASLNWLTHPLFGPHELFVRLVALPEAGASGVRSEVLLAAFCRDIVACADDAILFEHGDRAIAETVLSVLVANSAMRAAVGFRL